MPAFPTIITITVTIITRTVIDRSIAGEPRESVGRAQYILSPRRRGSLEPGNYSSRMRFLRGNDEGCGGPPRFGDSCSLLLLNWTHMKTYGLDEILDIVIVGVGPPALVALHDARQAGLRAVGIDKGPICSALVRHPTYMQWFSTSDRLELAGFPLLVSEKNPTRREYLKYCRAFATHHGLEINTYREVTAIEKTDDLFLVTARDPFGRPYAWRAHNVVAGTGYYDSPRPMNVPGEELPHVSHEYREPHHYAHHDVLVVGGGSSAAEAALECWREGANVTVVMRSETFHTKFWVEPDIENRIAEASIACYRNARVKEIRPDDAVIMDESGAEIVLPIDFVLAMTGYEPDTALLKNAGADVDERTNKPVLTEALESTVSGLYVMGTLIAGVESNVIFIENSRDHGAKIVENILRRRASVQTKSRV